MESPYTPEFLASLSDGELAAHLFDTISDCGEEDDATKRLNAEVARRGLTDKQVSEAYFTGQATS